MTTSEASRSWGTGRLALDSLEFVERFTGGEVDAPIAIIVTDVEGTVTHWNPFATTLFGWRAEEAIGASVIELNVGPLDEAQANEIMETLRAGRPWSGSFDCRRHDGSTLPIVILDVPLRDVDGEIIGIAGFSRESADQFSEMLEALDELRALADRLDDVRTDVKRRVAEQLHDQLSQPIAMLATESLHQAEHAGDPEYGETFARMGRELQRVLSVLQVLCTWLSPADLDDLEAATSVDLLLSSWADASTTALESVIDPAIIHNDIAINAVLVRILTEVLSNIERHAEATIVQVEIIVDGDTCTCTVVDDGIGYDGQPGFGIRLMRDRARRVGGKLEIDRLPSPQRGTRVTFVTPTAVR